MKTSFAATAPNAKMTLVQSTKTKSIFLILADGRALLIHRKGKPACITMKTVNDPRSDAPVGTSYNIDYLTNLIPFTGTVRISN